MTAPTVTLFLRISPELKQRMQTIVDNPKDFGRSYWPRTTLQTLAKEALEATFPPPAAASSRRDRGKLASKRGSARKRVRK